MANIKIRILYTENSQRSRVKKICIEGILKLQPKQFHINFLNQLIENNEPRNSIYNFKVVFEADYQLIIEDIIPEDGSPVLPNTRVKSDQLEEIKTTRQENKINVFKGGPFCLEFNFDHQKNLVISNTKFNNAISSYEIDGFKLSDIEALHVCGDVTLIDSVNVSFDHAL